MGWKDAQTAKEYHAAYYQKNKKKLLAYFKKNAYKSAEYRKQYQKDNLEKIKAQRKLRAETGVVYRLSMGLRSRVNRAIKGKYKSGSAVDQLGCSIDEFKLYIESKFLSGMTWDNWSRSGWHLDHIKPLVQFDLSNPEEFRAAAHYTNMQPLWAEVNLRKNKYA